MDMISNEGSRKRGGEGEGTKDAPSPGVKGHQYHHHRSKNSHLPSPFPGFPGYEIPFTQATVLDSGHCGRGIDISCVKCGAVST